jgi:hypothetical protein
VQRSFWRYSCSLAQATGLAVVAWAFIWAAKKDGEKTGLSRSASAFGVALG